MGGRETERIIAFHGVRRGAARIRAGREGTCVTLTLRPEQKGAPVPTAICLGGMDGEALRIPLTGCEGRAAQYVDPAVLLLIAEGPGGEVFCAEGARGALDRRAIEGLKCSLRPLRREAAVPKAKGEQAPAPVAAVAGEEQEPAPAPRMAEPPAKPVQTPIPRPQPQSEALRDILAKANELFPPNGAVEGHFASDAPLHGPFVPRPLAPQAEGRKRIPAGQVQDVRAGDGGADPAWRAAVLELNSPEGAPKPAGVGRAEAADGSLFPDAFPGMRWRRVRYPGTRRYYLEGTGHIDGVPMVVYALPGEKYPPQPYHGRGFTRFVRDVNGNGYWVKVRRRQ